MMPIDFYTFYVYNVDKYEHLFGIYPHFIYERRN